MWQVFMQTLLQLKGAAVGYSWPQLGTFHHVIVTMNCVPSGHSALLIEQAAQEQRANKGAVTTAVRGPSRPRGSSMSASAAIADAFKAALDEVERNYSTQVRDA
jgi:hypothetical protein